MRERKTVNKRNIVLKIETYERLDKYKIQLISEKGDSKLTFDDTIFNLLDRVNNKNEKAKDMKNKTSGI